MAIEELESSSRPPRLDDGQDEHRLRLLVPSPLPNALRRRSPRQPFRRRHRGTARRSLDASDARGNAAWNRSRRPGAVGRPASPGAGTCSSPAAAPANDAASQATDDANRLRADGQHAAGLSRRSGRRRRGSVQCGTRPTGQRVDLVEGSAVRLRPRSGTALMRWTIADSMTALFWAAFAFVLYVYVGYPALLAAWARIAPRPVRARSTSTPELSIIVAARDEGRGRCRTRLDNLLASDYPAAALQIIVVSDGSTDSTADSPPSLSRQRSTSILLPPGGKARALNAGVDAARHDVLVFADARQTFARDALRALVAPLADPACRRRLGRAGARL